MGNMEPMVLPTGGCCSVALRPGRVGPTQGILTGKTASVYQTDARTAKHRESLGVGNLRAPD